MADTSPRPTQHKWTESSNLKGFREEIQQLGDTLRAGQGEQDWAHFRKILLWNRALWAVGIVTLGLFPNPLTVVCLSLAIFSRWTMVGHHVSHGGYERMGVGRYRRSRFGMGSLARRAVDWLDWMLPEAWNLEHNKYHHYSLNEEDDPDLVEENLSALRDSPAPMAFKYLTVLFFMLTWKWFYYSPNTFSRLRLAEGIKKGENIADPASGRSYHTLLSALRDPPSWLKRTELLLSILGPYFVFQFLLLPLPFLLISWAAYRNALLNLLLAELLTNFHSFLVVVTNHAGDDLYRFDTKCTKDTFFLRQVLGSVNYRTSGDVNDFLHGFLNYQIEHHLWPDLSMLSYQRGQGKVKGICEKYGVPYVQESVWRRLVKTVDVMVGRTKMLRFQDEKVMRGV